MARPEDPQDPDHAPEGEPEAWPEHDAEPEEAAWEEQPAEEEPQQEFVPYYEEPAPQQEEPSEYYREQPQFDLQPPGRGRVVAGLVIAVATLLGFGVVLFGASQDWRGEGETWAVLSVNEWGFVAAALFVLAAVLVLTGLGGVARPKAQRGSMRAVEEPEPVGPAEEGLRVDVGVGGWTPSHPESAFHDYKPAYVADAEGERQKLVFTYPEIARGGIFGDVEIDVGSQRRLKVRSRLVRPCTLCEERFVCWNEYKDRLSQEVFYSNYHCRPGLAELAAQAQRAPAGT